MNSFHTRNPSLFEKRVNTKYLLDGYSRENCSSSSFIPSSVLDLISFYYPSMNGHSFIWNLKLPKLTNLTNGIDSDVFDIGLSNKFFLRLTSTNTDRERGKGRRRGDRDRASRDRDRSMSPTIQSRRERKEESIATTEDNVDTDSRSSKPIRYLILSLMSFPLPTSSAEQTFHCELYFHQINAQYSRICNQLNEKYDDRSYNNHGGGYNNNNRDGQVLDNDGYIKHEWKINYDLDGISALNELTFECKINVLKIIYEDIFTDGSRRRYNRRGRGGYRGGYRGYGGYGGYGTRGYIDHSGDIEVKPYNYVALGGNNPMRFIWHIVDKSIIDKLTRRAIALISCSEQYHSDVFYDMFQLQIGWKTGVHYNYFQIQICGLPENTDKMGVKLELFATDINTEKNRIQIMSNIVTFSYDSPIYKLSDDKQKLMMDLLFQCKNLSILCIANIIHKYDEYGDEVKENEVKILESADGESNNEELENKQDTERNSFVWTITDKTLLDKIKTSSSRFNSKIFNILGHQWFITIHKPKPMTSTQNILIAVNCILNERNIDCMVNMELLETTDKYKYYEQFNTNWPSGYFGRVEKSEKSQSPDRCLLVSPQNIERLNKLSIKVMIEIINDNQDNMMKEGDNEYNEIKMWLREKVCLEEYYPLFIKHGITDLNVAKLLSNDTIHSIGIHKIGHKLKMLHEINKLNPQNMSPNTTKSHYLLFVSICILCLSLLCSFYSF